MFVVRPLGGSSIDFSLCLIEIRAINVQTQTKVYATSMEAFPGEALQMNAEIIHIEAKSSDRLWWPSAQEHSSP